MNQYRARAAALIASCLAAVFGCAVGIFIGANVPREGRAPGASAPPAPAASFDAHAELEQIGRTMSTSSEVMAETSVLLERQRKLLKQWHQTEVTEYPIAGEKLANLKHACLAANGDAKFRGGWAPFDCWSRAPDCEPLDSGTMAAGMCMEGPLLFRVYQVPVGALY